jgi:hypothetical protein
MPRFVPRTALAGFALAVLAAAPPGASGPAPRDLLREVAGVTNAEWDAIERGEPVAKVLETDTREIAVAGGIKIRGSLDALIQRYRDIASLRKGAIVLDADRFSVPPAPADLQRVPLDDYNLDLRDCHAGDCRVRLSADDVARFRREVRWSSPDWRRQSTVLWHQVLAAHAAAYAAQGRTALPTYVNKHERLSVASEYSQLLARFGFLAAYSPDFHRYIQELGPRLPSGADQMLYWTKEDFGVRPVVRISHQVTLKLPTGIALVAINQVYADHYLDAALSVAVAMQTSAAGSPPQFHMVVVNRARTRSLTGFLRRFVRSTVQGRSRDAMRKILTSTKTALERN